MSEHAHTAPMHRHDHAHSHGHTHGHGHSHTHEAAPLPPRFSLVALSAGARLALVLPAIAALWGLAVWALNHG